MRTLSIFLCLAVSLFGSPALAEGTGSHSASQDSPSRPRSGLPIAGSTEGFAAYTDASGPMLALALEDEAMQIGEIEARIAELESRRAAIGTRGPRAAVVTGAVMTGVGFGIAALAGILCAAASSGSSTTCNGDNAAGLAAGGGAVGVIGIVTLVTGSAKLRERKREREELEREIESLKRREAERSLPSLSFGIGSDRSPGLVLGWQF